MRIIVTGAGENGFLGKHVKKEFNNECLNAINEVFTFGSEIDLLDSTETNYMFREFKPDIVVHMAAVCGGILANKNSPADFLNL